MLLRNMCEPILLARVLKNSKHFFSSPSISNKKAKNPQAAVIKKLNKENKKLYGDLHETKIEKIQRRKWEAKGLIPKEIPKNVDSELAFILQSSNTKRLTLIKNAPKTIPYNCEYKIIEYKSNESSAESQNVEPKIDGSNHDSTSSSSISSKNKNVVKPTKNANDSNLKIQNESVGNKKNSLFSKDSLPSLIEVPVFVKYKCFDDNTGSSENSEILSISPMEARPCLRYPSVTKVLSATMTEDSKAVLEKWKQKMIDKLGLEGFETYREELFANGKLFHATVMNTLTNQPDPVPEKIKPTFESLSEVLQNIKNVRAVESHAIHPKLKYRGVVDCIASYRGELCVIDWKKSDKPKHTIHDTYEAPLQLASYIGAINADLKYPFMIKKGLIIVAYSNGDPAKVHPISENSLQMYWKLWLERLTEYHSSLDPN